MNVYADRVIVIQYHARKYLQRKKVRKLSYEESNQLSLYSLSFSFFRVEKSCQKYEKDQFNQKL